MYIEFMLFKGFPNKSKQLPKSVPLRNNPLCLPRPLCAAADEHASAAAGSAPKAPRLGYPRPAQPWKKRASHAVCKLLQVASGKR